MCSPVHFFSSTMLAKACFFMYFCFLYSQLFFLTIYVETSDGGCNISIMEKHSLRFFSILDDPDFSFPQDFSLRERRGSQGECISPLLCCFVQRANNILFARVDVCVIVVPSENVWSTLIIQRMRSRLKRYDKSWNEANCILILGVLLEKQGIFDDFFCRIV